ncbi:MAG: hypothetical protein LVQ63_02485 [Thermoplasmatales archaeon]|nr:hypothetical protein [Thermoplasmatales archaeon]
MFTLHDFIKETADLYAKNSKNVMRIETYKKFFPLILSSLVTLLLSIFSVLGQEVSYATAIFLGALIAIIFLFAVVSISVILVDHSRVLYGLKLIKCVGDSEDCINSILKPEFQTRHPHVNDKIVKKASSDNSTYQVLTLPLYQIDYKKGAKKTVMELVDMMFVILLPGGLFDIIYGLIISPGGLEGIIRNVLIGIVVVAASLIFLKVSLTRKKGEIRASFELKANLLKSLLEDGYKRIQNESKVEIFFPPIEA